MKFDPRWGRLARAVERWWYGIPEPELPRVDRFLIDWVWKLMTEYDENYARRVGTMSPYAKQAAAYVEQEGIKRAPTLESEVRLLALAINKLGEHVEALERHMKAHDERIKESKR